DGRAGRASAVGRLDASKKRRCSNASAEASLTGVKKMPLNEDEKAELVAYLDGELDEAATQAVEAKIATDPDARAEIDALKQTWGMLDFLPKASPSPNFTNRTMERLTLENVPAPAAKTMPMPRRRVP